MVLCPLNLADLLSPLSFCFFVIFVFLLMLLRWMASRSSTSCQFRVPEIFCIVALLLRRMATRSSSSLSLFIFSTFDLFFHCSTGWPRGALLVDVLVNVAPDGHALSLLTRRMASRVTFFLLLSLLCRMASRSATC